MWLSITICSLMFAFVLCDSKLYSRHQVVISSGEDTVNSHVLSDNVPDDLKKKKSLLNIMTHAWNLLPRVLLIHVCHDLLVTGFIIRPNSHVRQQNTYFIW